MSVSVRCANPACRKPLRVKEGVAGKRIKCPACGQSLVVPAAGIAAVVPAPLPAPRSPHARWPAFAGGAIAAGLVGIALAFVFGWGPFQGGASARVKQAASDVPTPKDAPAGLAKGAVPEPEKKSAPAEPKPPSPEPKPAPSPPDPKPQPRAGPLPTPSPEGGHAVLAAEDALADFLAAREVLRGVFRDSSRPFGQTLLNPHVIDWLALGVYEPLVDRLALAHVLYMDPGLLKDPKYFEQGYAEYVRSTLRVGQLNAQVTHDLLHETGADGASFAKNFLTIADADLKSDANRKLITTFADLVVKNFDPARAGYTVRTVALVKKDAPPELLQMYASLKKACRQALDRHASPEVSSRLKANVNLTDEVRAGHAQVARLARAAASGSDAVVSPPATPKSEVKGSSPPALPMNQAAERVTDYLLKQWHMDLVWNWLSIDAGLGKKVRVLPSSRFAVLDDPFDAHLARCFLVGSTDLNAQAASFPKRVQDGVKHTGQVAKDVAASAEYWDSYVKSFAEVLAINAGGSQQFYDDAEMAYYKEMTPARVADLARVAALVRAATSAEQLDLRAKLRQTLAAAVTRKPEILTHYAATQANSAPAVLHERERVRGLIVRALPAGGATAPSP